MAMDLTLSFEERPAPADSETVQTFWELFLKIVHKHPDATALICAHQRAYHLSTGEEKTHAENDTRPKLDCLRWSFSHLLKVVQRVAERLIDNGILPGSAVVTFLPNCAEYMVLLLASHRLQATFVPIHHRNLTNQEEVRYMFDIVKTNYNSTRPFIFAGDQDTAQNIERILPVDNCTKFILSPEPENLPAWHQFSTLLHPPFSPSLLPPPSPHPYHPAALFFTSGTTSLPKPVPYTPYLTSHHRLTSSSLPWARKPSQTLALSLPTNHLFTYLVTSLFQLSGVALLLTGAEFEARTFEKAMREEKPTHVAGVPTMLKALRMLVERGRGKFEGLESVFVGGSNLSNELLEMCVGDLGAGKVCIAYGSTEGAVIYTGDCDVEELVTEDGVVVGRCMLGQAVKVCDADGEVVRRGVKGELWQCSRTIAGRYLGRGGKEDEGEISPFVEEDGKTWYRTGDQAVMRVDGRVVVTGRYKDIIIRGGKNLSPGAIEKVIQMELPELESGQVVGAMDEHAGEVPVLVVKEEIEEQMFNVVKRTVVKNMGLEYAIDEVFSLRDLGLDAFPTTTLGKVQKTALKATVNRVRSARTDGASKRNTELLTILAKAAGAEEASISGDTLLTSLGDSITLMRLREEVRNLSGVVIPVADITNGLTVGGLLELVGSHRPSQHTRLVERPQRPPQRHEIAHVAEDDASAFESAKLLITETIVPFSLDWKDVRDVMVAPDFTRIAGKSGMLGRWSHFVIVHAKSHSVEELRRALSIALENNSMLASFLLFDHDGGKRLPEGVALQITVKNTPQLLDRVVTTGDPVTSVEELETKVLEESCLETPLAHSGPLFRAWVHGLQEENGAAFVWDMHHAVVDVRFLRIFLSDLDTVLSGLHPLIHHVPLKQWCDAFYSFKYSPLADEAVSYHTQRLCTLSEHTPSIWPPLGSLLNSSPTKPDGYIHTFSSTSLQSFVRANPTLNLALILKATQLLFLARKTGTPTAILSQVESARTSPLPFIPSILHPALNSQDANDISGCLIHPVLSLVHLQPDAPLSTFLHHLASEQKLQTRHACAPWDRILAALDPPSAELFPQLAGNCMFNWYGVVNPFEKEYDNLEIVAAPARKGNVPFVVNCSVETDGGKGGVGRVVMHLRGSVFSVEELRGFGEELEEVAGWVCEEANWERALGDMLGLGKGR